MRGAVIIPLSPLEQQLSRAAEIQARLTDLLDELEQTGGRHANARVGGWRQLPVGWPDNNNQTRLDRG